MEERRNLLKKMEKDAAKKGLVIMATGYRGKKEDLQINVDNLKEVLFATQKAM
jgi:hypothetical protein